MSERPSVTFNIASQSGVINNVAGDQTVHGGQQAIIAAPTAVLDELTRLRCALAGVDLDPTTRLEATRLVDDAEQAARSTEPAAAAVAGPIERLTSILDRAGALGRAGAGLLEPLRRLVPLLGAAGAAIVGLLP